VIRLLLDLLFPHRCPACDAIAGAEPGFCEACRAQVTAVRDPVCPRCGTPSWGDGPGFACADCRSSPPPFEAAASAFVFGGPLGEAIARFKAGRIPEFPSIVAPDFAGAIRKLRDRDGDGGPFDVTLAVPPDPRRLLRRGFDPGTLVAAAAARRLGLRLSHGLLESAPRAIPQRSLGRSERQRALDGVFRATRRGRERLEGRRVLLLDDVRTTGSTVAACSRLLLDAGAASVRVATLALVE